MANYITVNETGNFPALLLTTDVANSTHANGVPFANGFLGGNVMSVVCLQDVTVTNSTGIFSWTDFCSASINKVTTPSDNEVSTNIVIDPTGWFGNSSFSPNTAAAFYGVSGLSENRIEVSFRVQLNDNTGVANLPANGTYYYCGKGYISSLAPTVSPDSPVWVSPLTIAVNGDMSSGVGV
jgi:hypothetical protein